MQGHGRIEAVGLDVALDAAAQPQVHNLVTANGAQVQANLALGRETLATQLERALAAKHATQMALDGRTRQQAAIARLGLRALASRDLGSTLDLLVREARATLGADFCSVLELGADGRTLGLRADSGWPHGLVGRGALCALGDAQAFHTLRARAAVVCDDLRAETRFNVEPLVLKAGVASGMSVILHGTSQAWGVVGAHAKGPRAFTPDDVIFLQAVANLMALAIERERAETALRHRNLQQAAVALLGRRALNGPHMDDLFADATREVAATLGVELCCVLQQDADRRTLLLRAGIGWQPGLVGAARVTAREDSQASFTLNADGPVLVADLGAETRFEPSEILVENGVVSGISVLVAGRNRPFGILGAYTASARAFTQDDSNFLQAVANLLASAIERHGVERELRRHRDDLEGLVAERTALLAASNRELEAFSYTISHDLRAPLRAINGLGKILQRKHGDTLPADAKEMLGLMADQAVRMGTLIDSILSLSRLGSVTLAQVPVDLSAAATSVLQALQTGEPARHVAWTVDPGLHAVGDPTLLRAVLENLLGNSWKFTQRTTDACITVSPEAGGFRVQDNGAGFDMAHARELFQPFHRLHPPDEFEGTGVGLATVSRIVARHGGRIQAHGVPGKGATFRVTLPQEAPARISAPV